jgi:hypothetical protein
MHFRFTLSPTRRLGYLGLKVVRTNMSLPSSPMHSSTSALTVVSNTLNELLRKAQGLEKTLMLKEVAERAQRQLAIVQGGNSGGGGGGGGGASGTNFPSLAVIHALLIGLSTKKPKLCQQCLNCLECMLRAGLIPKSGAFDAILAGSLNLSGKPVLWAIIERLHETLTVTETPVKLGVVECLYLMAVDLNLIIHGAAIVKMFQSLFNCELTTGNPYLKGRADEAIKALIRQRIMELFLRTPDTYLDLEGASVPPVLFASHTVLPQFGQEEEPSLYHEVVVDATVNGVPTAISSAQTRQHTVSLQACDLVTKDVILFIRTLATVGVRKVPGSTTSAQQVEVSSREEALRLLLLLFREIPSKLFHESEYHHQALRAILSLTKQELLCVICRNIASVAPSSYFTLAMDIISELALKCHFFLQREIYVLLNTVLFPIAKSVHSTFDQKVRIVHFVKSIVSQPDVAVGFFINYDCSSEFGDVRKLDGILEPMMTFVAELMYLDFIKPKEMAEGGGGQGSAGGPVTTADAAASGSPTAQRQPAGQPGEASAGSSSSLFPPIPRVGRLTVDQQSVLRDECVAVMHAFAASQFEWISGEVSGEQAPDRLDDSIDDGFPGTGADGGAAGLDDGGEDGSLKVSSAKVKSIAKWQQETVESDGAPLPISNPPPPAGTIPLAAAVSTGSITVEPLDQDQILSLGASATPSMTEGKGFGVSLPSSMSLVGSATAVASRRSKVRSYYNPDTNPFTSTQYHWTHIHQLYCNKKIIGEAVLRFNTNWKHGRAYLMDRKVLDGSYQQLAQWIRSTPAVHRETLCKIFERILKDEECEKILEAYLATFRYQGVPLDLALRDTTTEFMSFDGNRINFEAQVWDRIAERFGAEYAKQNNFNLSAADADVLAQTIIFLHTTLYNSNSNDKMTEPQFVRSAAECVGKRISDGELTAMYRRVAERKWGPKVVLALPESQIGSNNSGGLSEPNRWALYQPEEELLDGNMTSYAKNITNLSPEQVVQLHYLQFANNRFKVFESVLNDVYTASAKSKPRPFCVPVYAQHSRLILLRFYPQWVAAAYLGLRQPLQSEPILRTIEELYQSAFDIAAAFGINLTEQYALCEKMIQRCLRQPGAVTLSGLSSTLGLFLLRKV